MQVAQRDTRSGLQLADGLCCQRLAQLNSDLRNAYAACQVLWLEFNDQPVTDWRSIARRNITPL